MGGLEQDTSEYEGAIPFRILEARKGGDEGVGRDGFHGVLGKSVIFVQMTPEALVQVQEKPFIVLPYNDIELACLERVGFQPPLRVCINIGMSPCC